MMPIAPCKEPESSPPVPMPKIMMFRNDSSSFPSLEPSCYDPTFERFHFGHGCPNTMLLVNEPSEELGLMLQNCIYEDEDEDRSTVGSSVISQNGWRSAVKRFNINIAKCFRPPETQSFREIPMTPSVFSSSRRSGEIFREISRTPSVYSGAGDGEDYSMLLQDAIDEEDDDDDDDDDDEEAVEYDAESHPTASSSSSPSNTSNINGEGLLF